MVKTRAFVLVVAGATSAVLLAPVTLAVQAARRDESHEVVCSCKCGDETQTFEWSLGDDCAGYNGIDCMEGTAERQLTECEAKAVPKSVTVNPLTVLEEPTHPGNGPVLDLRLE